MEYLIKTTKDQDMIDVTYMIRDAVRKSGIKDGLVVAFIPHTTAGITINENADPDVVTDILYGLDKSFPDDHKFLHMEGNSHAHIKASFMGSSCNVIIQKGTLMLGIWQSIYFCEFDGPRNRKMYVKIIGD